MRSIDTKKNKPDKMISHLRSKCLSRKDHKLDNESLVKNEGALIRFSPLPQITKIEVDHFVKCNNFVGVDADESSYCLLAKTKDEYFFLYKSKRENVYYAENEATYEIPKEWCCVRLDRKGRIVEFMYDFVGFEIFTDPIKTMPYTYIDRSVLNE